MTKLPHPGDPAPPLDLPALDEGRVRLEDRRHRPVIVSFLRHAESSTCRDHVARLHERRDAVLRAGAYVVLVAFDEPEALRQGVLADLDLAFPVALDREKEAYGTWGLGHSPLWRRGRSPIAARQMGGDFVVLPGGVLAYVRKQVKDDRPPVEELLDVLGKLQHPG